MTTQQSVSHLKVGEKAPEFDLPAYPSGNISLSQYKGQKNVILAFYPKDDTPGCTKEMCDFSGDLSRFDSANTQVLGISVDDVESHKSFAAKHKLNQPLLSDTDKKVSTAYGVLKQDKPYADRVLFVIDKQGVIKHIHDGMPTNSELLEIIGKLG